MMFHGKLKYLFLLLGLYLLQLNDLSASDPQDNFGGFSKGFFNKQASPKAEQNKTLTPSNGFGGMKAGFLSASSQPKKTEKELEKADSSFKKPETPSHPSKSFAGLKFDFLSVASQLEKTEKESEKEVSSSNTHLIGHGDNSYNAALTLFEKSLEDTPELPESSATGTLWEHPFFLTPEARQQVYAILLPHSSFKRVAHKIIMVRDPNASVDWLNELESNFKILSGENKKDRELVLESPTFFNSFLKLWAFFQNSFSLNRSSCYATGKPEFLPFLMQNLAHWVIQSKFNYMESLLDVAKDHFKGKFITPDSTFEKGEFILSDPFWDTLVTSKALPEKPRIRYAQQTLNTKKKIYRLYDHDLTNNRCFAANGNPNLLYYAKGELYYSMEAKTPWGNHSVLNFSGIILDKNLNFLEKEGLVFTKGWCFVEYYHLFSYEKHPTLDEMFFFEKAIFNQGNVPPLLEPLLEEAGGLSQLEAREFLFLPTPDPETDTMVSPATARMVLPYFLELKEAVNQNPSAYAPAQIGWIEETIEGLKTILVEEICSQEDKALDQKIATDLAEKEVKQQLENKSPDLLTKIEEAQKSIKETGEKRQKLRKKEKKKVIKNAIREKAQTIAPQVIQDVRRLNAINEVEEKYRRKAGTKKHFSESEVHELLGEMVEDLSSLGIERTGKGHARGSHSAFEIKEIASGNSTHINVAGRSQKTGYLSGTVKKIMVEAAQKARSIIPPKKN